MIQVYCNNEQEINNWLKDNHGKVEIMDFKMSVGIDDTWIMVVYDTPEE